MTKTVPANRCMEEKCGDEQIRWDFLAFSFTVRINFYFSPLWRYCQILFGIDYNQLLKFYFLLKICENLWFNSKFNSKFYIKIKINFLSASRYMYLFCNWFYCIFTVKIRNISKCVNKRLAKVEKLRSLLGLGIINFLIRWWKVFTTHLLLIIF